MGRKVLLSLLASTVLAAAMSAFTAQMVNIQAQVEKDIAVEPVICDESSQFGADYSQPCFIDPEGGDYGVTLPQEFYDKEVEVTLSNSFFEQDQFFDLSYDVLWECKQFSDERDVNPVDGIPDCREDGLDDTLLAIDLDGDTLADTILHGDPEKLDGNIRHHIVVNAKAESDRCQTTNSAPPQQDPATLESSGPAPPVQLTPPKIQLLFSGTLTKDAKKCRYELKFFAPPCEDGFNPYTDPHPLAEQKKPIFCHKADKDRDGNPDLVDPQDIDEFADLGDEFKIQVFEHSPAP